MSRAGSQKEEMGWKAGWERVHDNSLPGPGLPCVLLPVS